MLRNLKSVALFAIIIIVLGSLSSCKSLYPSVMFRTKSTEIASDSVASESNIPNYRLREGDVISFKIFSNNGYKIVDQGLQEIGIDGQENSVSLTYIVDKKGNVRLPVLGPKKLKGMSIPEAEKFLEKEYSTLIKNPYVTVNVENWRVFLFKGSTGQIVNIENQNTSLVEVLARSGGLPQNCKSNKIKIIRGELENAEVFLVDYSTLENARRTDFQLQANDMVYIEPTTKVSSGLLQEIQPFIGLVTTFFLILNLFGNNG